MFWCGDVWLSYRLITFIFCAIHPIKMPKSDNKPSEKRKRLVLTIKQKLEIVKRLEKGESRSKIMYEFNVSSSTLYDLKKQKDKLLEFMSNSEGPTKKFVQRKTLKQPKFSELDKALYLWFSAKRSEGKPITGPMIIEKAKLMKEELGLEGTCNYSDGWLRNFKERHGIRKQQHSYACVCECPKLRVYVFVCLRMPEGGMFTFNHSSSEPEYGECNSCFFLL